MLLTSIKPNDWVGVRKNFQKLGSLYLGERSVQTFADLTLTNLTASRLVSTDANKQLESVSDLTSWVAGTANQITVTDDADGTVTLSTPQDIHTDASPTFDALTLSETCAAAGGLSVLRVTGLQTDGTAMTGTLRGAYIDVSNGSTAATGTIRGMELKARTEAPGDTGNDVTVLEGLSISADSKDHSVTTMRAAEFILDGSTGGTITEAVGLRIANNLQANKATTSYGLQIYRDSFDYTADIQLSNGATVKNFPSGTIDFGSANLITSSLTAGRILFAGTDGVLDDDAALVWDDVNKRFSIGAAEPDGRFTIQQVGDGLATTEGIVMYGSATSVHGDYSDIYVKLWIDHWSVFQFKSNSAIAYRGSYNWFDSDTFNLIDYGTGSFTQFRDNNQNSVITIRGAPGNVGFGDEDYPETLTEWTGTAPYLTLHNSTHEDTDGGRESRLIFKGEQSGGEETELAQIEVSHDGSSDDQFGKMVYSVNTGAGIAQALEIGSNLAASFTKIKLTEIGGYAIKLTNKTGGNTVAGQTVKADTASDDGVILTAADDNECIGVFLDSGVADDAEAWVVVAGIADIAMEDNTAATHGNWVQTSETEAGYADSTDASPQAAPQHFNEIGHCIESVAASGAGTHILARCVLHFN